MFCSSKTLSDLALVSLLMFILPCLLCFIFGYFLFSFFFLSGDKLAYTNSTLYAKINPQWLSEPRRLWPNVP